MQQAGVILSDYATLMVEILKDNASPLAGPVYGALDMPWATLAGQIAKAYGKEARSSPVGACRPASGQLYYYESGQCQMCGRTRTRRSAKFGAESTLTTDVPS